MASSFYTNPCTRPSCLIHPSHFWNCARRNLLDHSGMFPAHSSYAVCNVCPAHEELFSETSRLDLSVRRAVSKEVATSRPAMCSPHGGSFMVSIVFGGLSSVNLPRRRPELGTIPKFRDGLREMRRCAAATSGRISDLRGSSSNPARTGHLEQV